MAGPAEQIALTVFALESGEGPDFGFVLDALGDGRHVERLGQPDDALNDTQAGLAAQHRGHETAVDLERVDGEAMEVAEARIAGPEIVDGDAQAEFLEPVENGGGNLRVADQRALGEFDLDVLRTDGAGGQRVAQIGDHAEVGEAQPREIDAEKRSLAGRQALVDLGQGVEGGGEQPPVEVGDQAAGFGDRDELARRHQAAVGMLPADQRLVSGDAASLEPDDGLHHQPQLASRNAIGELLLELDMAAKRRVVAVVVVGPAGRPVRRRRRANQFLDPAEAFQQQAQEHGGRGIGGLQLALNLLGRDRENLGLLDRARGGRARAVVDERHLAENLARAEQPEAHHAAVAQAADVDLAAFDDVRRIARRSLAEYQLAGLKDLTAIAISGVALHLVSRPLHRPVDGACRFRTVERYPAEPSSAADKGRASGADSVVASSAAVSPGVVPSDIGSSGSSKSPLRRAVRSAFSACLAALFAAFFRSRSRRLPL